MTRFGSLLAALAASASCASALARSAGPANRRPPRAAGARAPITSALAAGLVAGLLYGCATGLGRPARPEGVAGGAPSSDRPARAAARPSPARECCVVVPASASQRAIARTAAGYVGAPRVEVGGRRLPFDCSGLARAVYLAHGIDLYDGVDTDDTANGVRLIWRHVAARGRIFQGPDPRPGDLVFFNDTWDRNGDGRVNDLLTHVGIVERVEEDGTVVFVSRVSRGIQRYRMNLAAPSRRRDEGRVLNDYLRRERAGDPLGTRYLTGELFAGFGRLAD